MTRGQSDEAARVSRSSSFTRPPPASLRVRQAVFGFNTAFERRPRETEAAGPSRSQGNHPRKS